MLKVRGSVMDGLRSLSEWVTKVCQEPGITHVTISSIARWYVVTGHSLSHRQLVTLFIGTIMNIYPWAITITHNASLPHYVFYQFVQEFYLSLSTQYSDHFSPN
jgi:hypothetical protein